MTKVTPKVRAPKKRANILVRKACQKWNGGLAKLNDARDLSFVWHALPHLGRHEVSERNRCQGIQAGADGAAEGKVKTRKSLRSGNGKPEWAWEDAGHEKARQAGYVTGNVEDKKRQNLARVKTFCSSWLFCCHPISLPQSDQHDLGLINWSFITIFSGLVIIITTGTIQFQLTLEELQLHFPHKGFTKGHRHQDQEI